MASPRIEYPDIDVTQFEACVAEQRELAALLEKEKPAISSTLVATGLFSSPVSPATVQAIIAKNSLIDDADMLLTIFDVKAKTRMHLCDMDSNTLGAPDYYIAAELAAHRLLVERNETELTSSRFYAGSILVDNAISNYLLNVNKDLKEKLNVVCRPDADVTDILARYHEHYMRSIGHNYASQSAAVSKIPFTEISQYLKTMYSDLFEGWTDYSSAQVTRKFETQSEIIAAFYKLLTVQSACKLISPGFEFRMFEDRMTLIINSRALAEAKSLLFTAEAPKPKLGM